MAVMASSASQGGIEARLRSVEALLVQWPGKNKRAAFVELFPIRETNVLLAHLNSPQVQSAMVEHYDHLTPREKAEKARRNTTCLRAMGEGMRESEAYAGFYEYATKYNQARTSSTGRHMASRARSYANMPRSLRATLASAAYVDVDIVNAHPVLLRQLLAKHGLPPNPSLEEYLADREGTLRMVSSEMGISRGVAKTILLQVMNNGAGNPDPGAAVRRPLSGFAARYKQDMKATLDQVFSLIRGDPVKFKSLQSAKAQNIKGSTINLLLCEAENQCLYAIFKALCRRGYEVDVLCFDGCMVRKRWDAEAEAFVDDPTYLPQEALDAVALEACWECGYTFNLIVKPFVAPVDVNTLENQPVQDRPTDVEMLNEFHQNWGRENLKIRRGLGYVFHPTANLWENLPTESVGPLITNHLAAHYSQTLTDPEIGPEVQSYLGASRTAHNLGQRYVPDALTYQASDEEMAKFNRVNPYLVPFSDKVIDVRDLSVRPRLQSDCFTYAVPWEFDAAAGARADVAEFIASFFYVHGDEDRPPYADDEKPFDEETLEAFNAALGLSLTGLNTKKAFFVVVGQTNAGKSFIFQALRKALGRLVANVSNALLVGATGNSHIQSYYEPLEDGPRLAFASEFKSTQRLSEDQVKVVTSFEPIRWRPMRSVEREFVPITKVWAGPNEMPKYNPTDTAITGRMYVFPFRNRFTEDPRVAEKVLSDDFAAALFSYCVLQAHCFVTTHKEKLWRSDAMVLRQTELDQESNAVAEFAEQFEPLLDLDGEPIDQSDLSGTYAQAIAAVQGTPIPYQDLEKEYFSSYNTGDMSKRQFSMLLCRALPLRMKVNKVVNGRRVKAVFFYQRVVEAEET